MSEFFLPLLLRRPLPASTFLLAGEVAPQFGLGPRLNEPRRIHPGPERTGGTRASGPACGAGSRRRTNRSGSSKSKKKGKEKKRRFQMHNFTKKISSSTGWTDQAESVIKLIF